mgnify:CR=1 FL=1
MTITLETELEEMVAGLDITQRRLLALQLHRWACHVLAEDAVDLRSNREDPSSSLRRN